MTGGEQEVQLGIWKRAGSRWDSVRFGRLRVRRGSFLGQVGASCPRAHYGVDTTPANRPVLIP